MHPIDESTPKGRALGLLNRALVFYLQHEYGHAGSDDTSDDTRDIAGVLVEERGSFVISFTSGTVVRVHVEVLWT